MSRTFVIAALGLFLSSPVWAQTYSVIRLAKDGPAMDVSDSGLVVGCSRAESGFFHAFAGDRNGVERIPGLGDFFSCPRGVNNAGQVVGGVHVALGAPEAAFVYDEKRGVQLIPGLGNAVPLDVNNRGDMVGNGIFDGRQGSFVYRGGAVTVLDHPPGVSVTVVRGVSDRGVMVGNAQIGTGSKSVSNLIVYSPDGEIEYLGTLDGVGATGLRINQRGDIIGWTWGDDGRPRGFVRNGDVTTYIEVPESAHAIFPRAINDRGDVVLDAQLLDGSRTIFIWSGGSLRDVSDAVDETGWQLTEVHAINNSGEIAARGFFEGQEYALLLVPHRH